MINDPVELAAMKQTTLDLIAADHISIVLNRSEWTRTPSGGMRQGTATPIAAQTFFFGAITSDPRVVQSDTGEMIVASHVIVGAPGADVQTKDEFKIGTRNYRVLDIHPDQSYQVKGWVVERA